MMAGQWGVIQVCSTPNCMVQCTHLITTGGTPHLYNRWSSMQVDSEFWSKDTYSVQISFIQTLKLIDFSWTIRLCQWQNVLTFNEKNNFLTVSCLSGLLSAEIFISTGEWGVLMPPLTEEKSHFLRSGPREATLVMKWINRLIVRNIRLWDLTVSACLICLFRSGNVQWYFFHANLKFSVQEWKGAGD